MKRIATAALAGWSAIVGLAWWLADRRLGSWCHYDVDRCKPALLAARDNVLIHGLTVALVGAIVLAVVLSVRDGRLNQTSQPDRHGLKHVGSKVAPTLGQKSRFLARLVERGGLKHLRRLWPLMLAVAIMLSAVVWIGSRDHGEQYPQSVEATEAATEAASDNTTATDSAADAPLAQDYNAVGSVALDAVLTPIEGDPFTDAAEAAQPDVSALNEPADE